jgi:hypothetical protein
MAQETEIMWHHHPSYAQIADNYDQKGYEKASNLLRDSVPQKHYPIHTTYLIFQQYAHTGKKSSHFMQIHQVIKKAIGTGPGLLLFPVYLLTWSFL